MNYESLIKSAKCAYIFLKSSGHRPDIQEILRNSLIEVGCRIDIEEEQDDKKLDWSINKKGPKLNFNGQVILPPGIYSRDKKE